MEEKRTFAIVATKNRPKLLLRALQSVAVQTKPPAGVLVIADSEEDLSCAMRSCEALQIPSVMEWLLNARTPNLSGALNTGIYYLLLRAINPDNTYVAFLDDDDWWESSYLANCLDAASRDNSDIVIAGIIRHEFPEDPGRPQKVPRDLTSNSFLIANPHIQGSNLFLRLSSLLKAGGFDENLESTTDRDLCIRLFDLGQVTATYLQRFLVHHWADNRPRLSSKGCLKKREGLASFYQKYAPRMTDNQRDAFKRRAIEKFGCTKRDFTVSNPRKHISSCPSIGQNAPIDLLVGFTITNARTAGELLKDLRLIFREFENVKRLVLCDNSGELSKLEPILSQLTNVEAVVISRERIHKDAAEGKFGTFYRPAPRQRGIAFGRTALHHYMYLESRGLKNPIAWILDDDVRVDRMLWANSDHNLSPPDFKRLLQWIKSQGHLIAIGKIVGDAPLPAGSTLRTQLLDLLFNIQAFTIDREQVSGQERRRRNNTLMKIFPDYYYDLSLRHTRHLETPLWFPEYRTSNKREVIEKMLSKFPQVLQGVSVFRPVVFSSDHTELSEDDIPSRGGNTLVFDLESLRRFPNIAPCFDDLNPRRGDTIWSILHLHGNLEKGATRKTTVTPIPLQVRHDRGHRIQDFDIAAVLADLYGSAVTRSLNNMLEAKSTSNNWLRFTATEIDTATARFQSVVKHRLQLLLMNAWRIQGLAEAIGRVLKEIAERNDDMSRVVRPFLPEVLAVLRKVQDEFTPDTISQKVAASEKNRRGQFADFLENLSESCSSFKVALPYISSETQIENAKNILKAEFGIDGIRFVGSGSEGLVFTDGKKAFKLFHAEANHINGRQLEFLRNALGPEQRWTHVNQVHSFIAKARRLVMVTDLVEDLQYSGGHLDQVLDLLRECRRHKVVLKNISPSNVRIDQGTLKFIDIGADVAPFRPDLFRQMCKRAYLTYRWHFRPDLKLLMTKSLNDESIPELFGLELFLSALDEKEAHDYTDPIILEFLGSSKPESIFDYGCGSGKLAVQLAKIGKRVVAYDPNPKVFESTQGSTNLRFVDRQELEPILDARVTFDCVVCSLVVCTIPSNADVERLLAECRLLAGEDGFCILALCNPFNIATLESETHTKTLSSSLQYSQTFSYTKLNKKTGRTRPETHRPFSWYKTALERAGLSIVDVLETSTTDVPRLCPGSDFLVLKLNPVPLRDSQVSLLIKISSMEFRTARMQITHLVRQLEVPRRFFEKVVVTDSSEGPFARAYDVGNWQKLRDELMALVREGIVDRIVVAPEETSSIAELGVRWFGLPSQSLKSANGQPTLTTLHGMDECRTDLIFQVDGDILIHREDRNHDFLADMVNTLEDNFDALSVGFPVSGRAHPFRVGSEESRKWRTNVRCCLISKKRLDTLRPLPNTMDEKGILQLAWQRSVDFALKTSSLQNYRGGNPKSCHIHLQNERKRDINGWFSSVKSVEGGTFPPHALRKDEIEGDLADWIGRRGEELIVIVRGRNVPPSKLRRCFESLLKQSDQRFGLIVINASSGNEMLENPEYVVQKKFHGWFTIYSNFQPTFTAEHIFVAISRLCSNPNSIIVELDADDALIGTEVICLLKRLYAEGIDATVGSMLRTDKYAEYPVNFENPRRNRGGNVWQHLRSFRKYLFDQIDPNDLKIEDNWIPHNVDWAYMLPIIEMAKHPYHIKTPLYFYEPTGKRLITEQARKNVIGAIVRKKSYKPVVGILPPRLPVAIPAQTPSLPRREHK